MSESYFQKLQDAMQKELDNDLITIKLYHYLDNGNKVYDTDSIKTEFEDKLNVLEVKNSIYHEKQ
jgi:hypothetical protein